MFTDNAQETTTSIVSPLVLDGSSKLGHEFSTRYNQDEPIDFIWDDRNGSRGACIGHLDASGHLVIDLTVGGSTVIPEGPKQVFVGASKNSFIPAPQGQMDMSQILSGHVHPSSGGQLHTDKASNKHFGMAFLLLFDCDITHLGARCVNAGSGGGPLARIGLSRFIGGQLQDLYLADEPFDVTSAGRQEVLLSTPLKLKAGWYMTHFWCNDSTVDMEGQSGNSTGWSPMPSLNDINRSVPTSQMNVIDAGVTTALGSPLSLNSNNFDRRPPIVWMVGTRDYT